MRSRSMRRSPRRIALTRRVNRSVAVLILVGLALMAGTDDANASVNAVGKLSLSSFSSFVSSLTAGPPQWSNVPRQRSGTAAGLAHEVPASATRANQGVGRAPGTGKGALPAYAPYAQKAKQGLSRVVTGFSAKTSRRDAAKSTATSDYYQNADGSVTRKFAQAPINYKSGSGWQAIDTTVAKGPDGRWAEKANSRTVTFAPSSAGGGGNGGLVSVGADASHAISYDLQGAASVTGQASGSAVTYPGVLPDTDLAVAPTPTGVKESIVLRSAQAANSWVFPLTLKGLTAAAGKAGAIDLVDGSGKTVEEIPPAYAYDSKVDPRSGDPATTDAVSYALQTVKGKPSLVVTLDPKWLSSPARVFPVTVDPTVTDGWTTTYAESGNPGDHSFEQSIKVGSYDAGPHSANGFINHWYDYFNNPGVTVSAASLSLFDSWASICTPERFDVAPVTSSWTPSGVTSYPGPSHGASIGNLTPNVPDACANTSANRSVGDWVTVNLSTSTFQGWVSGPRRTTASPCTPRPRTTCTGSSSARSTTPASDRPSHSPTPVSWRRRSTSSTRPAARSSPARRPSSRRSASAPTAA